MMAETGVPVDGDGKLKDALLALGRAQIDAMFAQQGDSRFTVDDSEFVPMLECVLTAFESRGLGPAETRRQLCCESPTQAGRDSEPPGRQPVGSALKEAPLNRFGAPCKWPAPQAL